MRDATSDRAQPIEPWRRGERRLAWLLVAPALSALVLTALVPIGWTAWESLHLHDLRMPWLGRPFVGFANYREAAGDPRFLESVLHTALFAVFAVSVEMTCGLALALGLDRMRRGVRIIRTAVLLPWAVPTVVAALIWRFIFESPGGVASSLVSAAGVQPPTWLSDPVAAWTPILLADIWKTTPFVTLLLVAGLQGIDRSIYEAAAMDGAGSWMQFRRITLPLLKPALAVAVLFRLLDAFRVFDIVYVLTGGGPGTSTEPVAIYAFFTLMQALRFGYGSALTMIVFGIAFVIALAAVRLLSRDTLQGAAQ
jgi:ABC-type sugar transport system permease subunit